MIRHAAAEKHPQAGIRPIRILLVGNDLLSLEKLQQHLAEAGLQAEIAACTAGSLALEISAKCAPDIVMAHLDFLAGKCGGEVLQRIKAENPGVHTLSIARPEDYSRLVPALEGGIDDYVTFPFTGHELGARLRKAFIKTEKREAAPGLPQIAFLEPHTQSEPGFTSQMPRLDENTDWGERSFGEGRSKPARPGRAGARQGSPVLRILGNAFFAFLLTVLMAMTFFLVQSKLRGGPPEVAGFQMYVVLSGSMKPAFDTGSLAFVRRTDPENIVPGDIITYRSTGSAMLTTHRVVEVRHDGGAVSFITRGDANNINDPNPVPAANLVGRVSGAIPYLGYLMGFVQTRQGLIFLVFIPAILIIIFELRNIFRYFRKLDEQKKAAARGGATGGKKKGRHSSGHLTVSPRAGLITTHAATRLERSEQ